MEKINNYKFEIQKMPLYKYLLLLICQINCITKNESENYGYFTREIFLTAEKLTKDRG